MKILFTAETSKEPIVGDAFITRLNASGSALIYPTFVGGSEWENSHGIVIDSSNNAYITGLTTSTDMHSVNAAQPRPGTDVVMKSANSGSVWAGTGIGLLAYYVWDIRIDPSNPSVIYAGTNNGMFKSSNGGTNWDENVARVAVHTVAIDPTRPATVYISTSADDYSLARFVDGRGNPRRRLVDFSGTIGNGIFRSTDGGQSFDPINNGLPFDEDFFANTLAVDPRSPSTLYAGTDFGLFRSANAGANWSPTSLGGMISTGPDVRALALDAATSPSTIYASSTIIGDAFVTKINATGTAVIYSTYLGGLNKDEGRKIAIDSSSNVYVIGVAQSNNFPVSGSAPQSTFGGGVQDVFVTKLDAAGGFVYSTYLGGSGGDEGNGIAVDLMGNAYVTGLASGGFPVTAGALKTNYRCLHRKDRQFCGARTRHHRRRDSRQEALCLR